MSFQIRNSSKRYKAVYKRIHSHKSLFNPQLTMPPKATHCKCGVALTPENRSCGTRSICKTCVNSKASKYREIKQSKRGRCNHTAISKACKMCGCDKPPRQSICNKCSAKKQSEVEQLWKSGVVPHRDGECDICEKICTRVVDHKVVDGVPVLRGMLCFTCNSAIGLLNHDSGIIDKASKYCK